MGIIIQDSGLYVLVWRAGISSTNLAVRLTVGWLLIQQQSMFNKAQRFRLPWNNVKDSGIWETWKELFCATHLTHHLIMPPRRTQRLSFVKALRHALVRRQPEAVNSPVRMTSGEFPMKWAFWFSGDDGILGQSVQQTVLNQQTRWVQLL